MKMRRVPASRSSADMQPGDFSWSPPPEGRDDVERVLRVCLPVMCELSKFPGWEETNVDRWYASVPVTRAVPAGGNLWQWDGDVGAPTLEPSLNTHTGEGDDRTEGNIVIWHGHIRAGRLVFLDASPAPEGTAPVAAPEPEPDPEPEPEPPMTVGQVREALAGFDPDRAVEVDPGAGSASGLTTWPIGRVYGVEGGPVLLIVD